MGNTRGSEWRRWDLHVHTPESGMANGFSDWDSYVIALFNKALENKIAAIGITDYFTIDGYKKLKEEYLNNKGKMLELFKEETTIEQIKQIKLFPNIEFRLDIPVVKGKETARINYHVIFSDEISIKNIEENFLHEIYLVIENIPNDKSNKRKLTKSNIEDLGEKIKKEQPEFKGSHFNVGCSVAMVSDAQIMEILLSHKDIFEGKYVIVIPVDEDLSKIDWKSQGHMTRKNLYQEANMFFSSNPKTRDFGLGKKSDSIEAFISEFKSLKPCIHGSDAHSEDKLFAPDNNNFCWIKANTTFEGLKQILYEPAERVKIQATDPTLDYDKSPFTEIEILDNVKVFAKDENGNDIKDEDNIVFAKNTIPLNSGLVSIIGGRGTGKSKLIDYIANGLGKEVKSRGQYSHSENMCVKRKVSLREKEFGFNLVVEHNIPFMYISQSEIKNIVENQSVFSNKIMELIGIPDKDIFPISFDERGAIDNFRRAWDVLYADKNKGINRLNSINSEIKKYEDFIASVISERNKKTFEKYQTALTLLEHLNYSLKKANEIKNDVCSYKRQNQLLIEGLTSNFAIDDTILDNEIIEDLNGADISSINDIHILPIDNNNESLKGIERYISFLNDLIEKLNTFIENTKSQLPDYNGNLDILLDDVNSYRKKIEKLKEEKNTIERAKKDLHDIYYREFPSIVSFIKDRIDTFKENILNHWQSFVNGKNSFSEEKKTLLKEILGTGKDKIDLHINIIFDKQNLIEILQRSTFRFGRSQHVTDADVFGIQLNKYKTYQDLISNITDFESYLKTIECNPDGLERLIEQPYYMVLYNNFPRFIKYNIVITLNNKPLNRLSVGQRGSIYLRLQLAANLFSETIIYDQPEDDLDNEFITDHLVELFKKIKKYRQVIIVSHNANLVVNADSEQVIVASNNDGVLSYKSGSLEDPEINKEICKILEGGRNAFEKREQKYGFKSK